MSKSIEYDPEVTPSGNPEKLGVCVAAPAVPTPGRAVQHWMWDAVVVPSRPENVSETMFRVFAVVSIVITAKPVPGDALGGASPGPVNVTS
jgi:hypothetical protein